MTISPPALYRDQRANVLTVHIATAPDGTAQIVQRVDGDWIPDTIPAPTLYGDRFTLVRPLQPDDVIHQEVIAYNLA